VDRLAILGVGGLGREVFDVVRAINEHGRDSWDVVGFYDDLPSAANLDRLRRLGLPWLGTLDALDELDLDVSIAIGVGSPRVRSAIAESVRGLGRRQPVLVHPSAIVGSDFAAGAGSIVCGGTSIGTNVRLGQNVHLNPHAVLGHDVSIGDASSVNPNATVSGDCVIAERVLVGASAVVLQGLRVGPESIVGAGAVCVRDVRGGQVVKGVPAR
jgi:sugar O-acyltransferase (sialic acid O-acetyltransferase NeuD family)